MTILYAFVGASIVACALYMILSRNLVRVLLGLSLLATGANLLLSLAGSPRSQQPPIIPDGQQVLTEGADPLAQALVLTAIVIGFALTVVLAVLVLRAWRAERSVDARQVESAESLGPPQERDPTNA